MAMATRFSVAQEYATAPDAVLAMLTDENYVRTRAERTGASAVSVTREESADAITVTIVRELPAQLPSFAKSMVGDVIRVDEVQVWPLPLGAPATLTASFNAPMNVTGTITVTGDAGGTLVKIDGEVRASVPFVGGKLEGLAREQFERYLAAEVAIATEWLAGS
jgi:hypothetical protein